MKQYERTQSLIVSLIPAASIYAGVLLHNAGILRFSYTLVASIFPATVSVPGTRVVPFPFVNYLVDYDQPYLYLLGDVVSLYAASYLLILPLVVLGFRTLRNMAVDSWTSVCAALSLMCLITPQFAIQLWYRWMLLLVVARALSTKHIGRYEEDIIQSLTEYFQLNGYEVIPHSRFNIAWGPIVSDIDLLLLKDNALITVEVKSSRDNISRAQQQIDCISDYVDYAYVATDKRVKNWNLPRVGLIYVQGETVTIIKKARRLINKPRLYSLLALKKKCIARFFGRENRYSMLISKQELAQAVYARKGCTRTCLKEIVTCGELCVISCPIVQAAN